MSVRMTTAGQAIPGRLFPDLRPHWLTLLVAGIAAVLFLLEPLSQWATWQRGMPLGLQLWTAHFVHWSGGHFFWDVVTFGVLASLIESADRRLLVRLLIITPPVILASVWLMENHVVYRGLSGLDCALYTALVVMAFRRNVIGPGMTVLGLGLFIGKIAFEILTGNTLFVADLPAGITAVPWAHLSGAITGLLLGFCSDRIPFKSLDN
jgi:membrane associated rhomboid family serine protease